MRKYLDLTTWILLFALAPLTILVLLSQNSIPGDLFYPVKRGLENVVLAAASVSPSTRVAFRTDLTQRRFAEAQQLLVLRGDTTAFTNFVTEVSSAQQDLSNISSSKDKIQNADKLITKIDQYQTQLSQTQSQVQLAQVQVQNPQTSQNQSSSQPVGTQNPAFQAQQPILVPQPQNSSQPLSIKPTSTPLQTPFSANPSPFQAPIAPVVPVQTLAPSVSTAIGSNPQKAQEVKVTIDNTKQELEKIKVKLEKERSDAEDNQKIQEEQKKLQENLKKEKNATPGSSNE